MSNIQTERREGVLVISIVRPEKKNALTTAMYADLGGALDAAREDEEIRAVVLAGGPGMFTAGNDLMDFLQQPPASDESPVFRFLVALVDFPKPVVAAVDGVAIGIGTTLLLHCDIIVATARTRFALPFTKLALVPEAASSLLLPLAVGYHRAAEWLLLGEPFSGEDAHRAGLVNRLVEPEALESTALAVADALAALPPEAVQLSKRLIREPLRDQTLSIMRREAAVFLERLKSREAKRAFAAFLSKA
jgi:enoyl-CoA hydratase/carnithine racemase